MRKTLVSLASAAVIAAPIGAASTAAAANTPSPSPTATTNHDDTKKSDDHTGLWGLLGLLGLAGLAGLKKPKQTHNTVGQPIHTDRDPNHETTVRGTNTTTRGDERRH